MERKKSKTFVEGWKISEIFKKKKSSVDLSDAIFVNAKNNKLL